MKLRLTSIWPSCRFAHFFTWA